MGNFVGIMSHAMYFDQTWWGISNLEWTAYFLKTGKYISVALLLDDEAFYSEDCAITCQIKEKHI